MQNAALCDYVQRQAIYLLGERVARVTVALRDHDYELGVAIRTSDGWRHGVRGPTFSVRENPERWTELACQVLVSWLNLKAIVQLNAKVAGDSGAAQWVQ